MNLANTAELSSGSGRYTAVKIAHLAASRSSRVPQHHATSARASHGLSLRRTATALGTAALALSAAASVDLQERGPRLGRLRIDQGGWRDGPWAPRPETPRPREQAALEAILREPSCFDGGAEVLRGNWPDHEQFALHRTHGVTLATSNITGSTLACVQGRATRALREREQKEQEAAQKAYNDNVLRPKTVLFCVLMAVTTGIMLTVRGVSEAHKRRSQQSVEGDHEPLLTGDEESQPKEGYQSCA